VLFSDRPMHSAVSEPLQGMPSTSGSLPTLPGCDPVIELGCRDGLPGSIGLGVGTVWSVTGLHAPLAVSRVSPVGQLATAGSAGPDVDADRAATTGAAAMASVKPPASSRRCVEFFRVMAVLSVRCGDGARHPMIRGHRHRRYIRY